MESPQIKKTKLTSKNRHQLQYGYLSLLLMFASCESEQKKLPLAGFSSLYHVQFTLVSQCSTEYSLPYSFETDLQISTPNRLISTSVDSLSNTSSLPSSSQLASLTFSSSNTRGISIKRVPDLFNGLEFIGQTCPNESRSPSLCLMGYQNILFQTEVQQTQSSSPFSTCQLDVFFPSSAQSRVTLEQRWSRFEKLWFDFIQNGSKLDQYSLCCDRDDSPFSYAIHLVPSQVAAEVSQAFPVLTGTLSGQIRVQVDDIQSISADMSWFQVCGGPSQCEFEYQIEARPMESELAQ